MYKNTNRNFKKSSALLLTFSFFSSSCVTTHYGTPIESTDKKFSISCGENREISHNYISAISCSFENKSVDWIEFNISSMTTKPDKVVAKILTPSEISDFQEAYAFKAAKDDHNKALFLSGLLIVGTAAMMSHNSKIGTAGAVTTLGTAGYAAADGIGSDIAEHQYAHITYGGGHMLGGSFKVPAELFVRKHVVIQIEKKGSYPSQLEMCFASPKKECLTVPIDGWDDSRPGKYREEQL